MDCEDLSGNELVIYESDNDSQVNFEVSLGLSDIEKEDEEIMIDALCGALQTTDIKPELCQRCKSNLHVASECIASHDINHDVIVSDGEYDGDYEDADL